MGTVNNERVNLLVSCYGGNRRVYDPSYEADRSWYLKQQIDSLLKYEHNLDQVTFICAEGRDDYFKYIYSLPNEYRVIIRKDNTGLSYGSWNYGCQIFDDFDYYIFLEDDYLFVHDHFDRILVDMFKSTRNCGYLCSLSTDISPTNKTKYPAIMNGIISKSVVQKIGMPLPGATMSSYEDNHQHEWGIVIEKSGLELSDMRGRFRVPFIDVVYGGIIWWYSNSHESLIVPSQIYGREDESLLSCSNTTSLHESLLFDRGILVSNKDPYWIESYYNNVKYLI